MKNGVGQLCILTMWILLLSQHVNFVAHSAYRTNQGEPDIIFFNGPIITMEDPIEIVKAISVKDDTILEVGNETSILATAGSDTIIVDLEGKSLLPGFIDSHSHWIGDRGLGGYEEVEASINEALRYGWTSISELYVDQGKLDELINLDEQGILPVRVNAYLPLNYQDQRWGDWYKAYQPGQEFSQNLRIGGLKLTLDNGPGIGYIDRNYWFTQGELDSIVSEAHDLGFQLALHVIVDNSTDMALSSLMKVIKDEKDNNYRHRLEHSIMLRDDQIQLIKDNDIIVSLQLQWFDSEWIDEVLYDPGIDNAHLIARWQDVISSGIHAIGSTDYPWTMFSPVGDSLEAIHQVVTRIGEQGLTPPDWMLNQRLSVEQALRLITIDAAYGTFQEDVKGSLKTGKFADFVVLSENPLQVEISEIPNIDVLLTMIGGSVEYCLFEGDEICDFSITTINSSKTSDSLSFKLTSLLLAFTFIFVINLRKYRGREN